MAELHSRRLVHEQALAEERSDLVELLDHWREADGAQAREILRRLYFSGTVVAGEGAAAGAARTARSVPAHPDLQPMALTCRRWPGFRSTGSSRTWWTPYFPASTLGTSGSLPRRARGPTPPTPACDRGHCGRSIGECWLG